MKSPYRQKLEARLKEWDATINVLEARAQEAVADARIAYRRQMKKLLSGEKKLVGLGHGAWRSVRGSAGKAASSLKSVAEKAISGFK